MIQGTSVILKKRKNFKSLNNYISKFGPPMDTKLVVLGAYGVCACFGFADLMLQVMHAITMSEKTNQNQFSSETRVRNLSPWGMS